MSDLLCSEVWRRKIKKVSHRNLLLFLASQASDQGLVASAPIVIQDALDCSRTHTYKLLREVTEFGSLELIAEMDDADEDVSNCKLWMIHLDKYSVKEAVSQRTLSYDVVRSTLNAGVKLVSQRIQPMENSCVPEDSGGPSPSPSPSSPNDNNSNPLHPQTPPPSAVKSEDCVRHNFNFETKPNGGYFPKIVRSYSLAASMAVGHFERGQQDKPAIAFLTLNTAKTFDGLRKLLAAVIEDINRTPETDRQIGKLAELFMMIFGPTRFDQAEVFKRIGKMLRSAGTPANLGRRIMYFLIDQRGIIDDPFLALQHSISKKNSKYIFDWWMDNENLIFLREGDRNKVIRMRKEIDETQFIEHASKDKRSVVYTHESQRSRVKRFAPAPVPVAEPVNRREVKVR